LFSLGKTEQQIENLVKLNSFGRLGETDDITGMILFLASEEARWITGQTLRVNGGFV
jgi:3-oxoacyl-[acyl-carrier protein] reductase